MTNEIEKQYNELRKKYKLPEFKEIDSELELRDMEETSFLFRNICHKIAEKMDFYTSVIEAALNPDSSNYFAMHEARYFDEAQKKDMYELYKKLMNINRNLVELSLSRNEKEDAEFLASFSKEWKGLKQELLKYVKIMRNAWKTEINSDEYVGYLG